MMKAKISHRNSMMKAKISHKKLGIDIGKAKATHTKLHSKPLIIYKYKSIKLGLT